MKALTFVVTLALASTAHASRFDRALEALFGPAVGEPEIVDPDFEFEPGELLDLEGASGTWAWTEFGDLVFVPDPPRADEPKPCRKGLDAKGVCRDRRAKP